MRKIVLLVLSLLAILTSCKDSTLQEGGFLSVIVARDDSFDMVETKADAGELVFCVDVFSSKGVKVAHVDDHRSLEANPLKLRAGHYTVRLYSGEEEFAAFDSPYYEGETECDLVQGIVTKAEIVCSISNVKVSVNADQSIAENFESYALEVSNGKGMLRFDSADGTISKEGYFSCTGTLDWKLYVVNKDGQAADPIAGTIEDVLPRQHYIFRFDIGEANGASAIRITIDESMNDRQVEVTVPFDRAPVPDVKGNSFDMSNLEIFQGTALDRVVIFDVQGRMKRVTMSHTSQDIYDLGIPYEVDLLSADESALSAAGITLSGFSDGSTMGNMDITSLLNKLGIGSYMITFNTLDYESQLVTDELRISVLSEVDVMAVSSNPWAMFATVTGEWMCEQMPMGLGFEYREDGSQEWTKVENVDINQESKTFSANIYSLKPETKYYFRTVSDNDAGKESPSLSFVTEAARTIPNLNFDSWYKSGKTWYPKASASDQTWWDTANSGANVLSEVNPTKPESSFVAVPGSGKNAARLETCSVLGKLAAGNIYTGKFKKLEGVTAKLDFGVPFTGRPLGLKGYYSYAPKTINIANSPYEDMKGKTDLMQIYLMLTDWDTPFAVSSDGTFVSLDDPAIIAYGEIVTDQGTNGEYVPFEIKLEYRDTQRIPKHMVIICCASRYGDYFTGAVGSVLYVDEFELIYDPMEFE